MLNVSKDAAKLINTLAQDAALPDGAGMRITVNPAHGSLSMDLAQHPEPFDAITAAHGARVFMAPHAAQRLRRRTLYAEITAARSVFYLDR